MKPKTVVILIGSILLLLSALQSAEMIARGGEGLVPQLISSALTVVLFWFLIRGSNIARWVTVVLFGLSGILLTLMGTSAFSGNPIGIRHLVSGLVSLALVIGLITPPAARHFRKNRKA